MLTPSNFGLLRVDTLTYTRAIVKSSPSCHRLRAAHALFAAALALAAAASRADDSYVEFGLPPLDVGTSSTATAVGAPAVGATAAPAVPAVPDPIRVLLEHLPATSSTPSAESAVADPQGDLWQRIRAGFAMPDLETRIADQRTRWYAEQVDYFGRMTGRASRYLFYIVEEIERRGMPTELALLPFVESAFQPEAVSSAKAAGLWQFIPSTGRLYDLEQSVWTDERRSVTESTRAALDYLQKLYEMFGDWHLALAAYNWGEGAVSRAIEKNRRARKGTSYTDLRMPLETRHYVPKLQAVKNIVADPTRYGIELPPIPNSPYFVAVRRSRDIDVETAARLAEMDVADFRALNPQFNRPVIVGAASPTLLLPADRVDLFNANLAAWESTGQPLASWTTYRLLPDDSLATVSKRAGISEEQLRDANSIPPRYRLAAGSTILVPRDETMEDIAADNLDAQFALVPEAANLRKVTYRVRRGDTLHSVARRYRVSEKDVIVWNHLTAPTLFAGQRLELTIPVGRASKKSGGKAKPPPKASSKSTSPHGKVAAAR